ncbi:MMPL family transporter [Oecophyllibacter saccharovorans]|uniref:RND transporter n=1 Tax=Oecophyllibacter saccharovorans TaxID=2558360 RepID=A0A506UKS7_9PROT|nr:MMPL family transporter [Oecophyllibacter saccharovorans]TPW33936.1 RND transporter [Oecophyllibacter saccharovorans]
MLTKLTTRLNNFSLHHALGVVLVFLGLVLGALWVSHDRLGVTTDTDQLFSNSLGWKKRVNTIEKLFPGDKDSLVAVISADTPEEGNESAKQLAAILTRDHRNFNTVSVPADNPYYVQHAFELLPVKTLDGLLNSIIAAQPFLGTLAADPSARGLFSTFDMIATGIEHGQEIPPSFDPALQGMANALTAAADGHPYPVSWQRLLAGKVSDLGGQYQFVVTHPKRNFSSFEPAAAATRAMRAAIDSLPDVKAGHVHALITGEAKLSDEEFSTVAKGMVVGLVLSLALVTLWLTLAVRSPRIIIPILITLITGLVLTTGFAALAVGTLNLISVAFAILFVGIAVDFGIQYSVRFRSQVAPDGMPLSTLKALARTGHECGAQILIAALATACGFMAFIPTSFVGVAQLGLIAGAGMLIAFINTLTLLPALLVLFHAHPANKSTGFSELAPVDRFLRRHRPVLLCVFAGLALLSLALIPFLSFDSDPLHTKNPHTEGMRALHLLEQNPLTTPYSAQVLAPDEKTAARLAAAISKLSSVNDVLWLGALVPEQQPVKREMIADAADMLLPSLDVSHPAPPPTAQELRESATKAADALQSVPADKLNAPLKQILAALRKLEKAPDGLLLQMNADLTRFLPDELNQLRTALTPTPPVTLENIPADIRRQYVTPDGRYLLIIHPKGQMSEPKVLHHFVSQLRTVTTNLAGPAAEIIGSAHTMIHAFTVAGLCAICTIALVLLIALRRPQEMGLVIATLVMSSLMTVIVVVCCHVSLNYANIIALPLLLGVGVSFNIYFVMNWSVGTKDPLVSPTARAVLFSALTTGSAFGSLALSQHPGTSSMGKLLMLSLACTLFCTLIFLPTLLPSKAPDPGKAHLP